MLKIKRNEVNNLLKENKNRIFTALFEKKDGSIREIKCRLGVKKYLKGGKRKYNPSDFNYLCVFDMVKQQYRTININTLKSVALNKKVYTVI